MQLLGFPEAQHYCAAFTARPGDAALSLRTYRRLHLKAGKILVEHTPALENYRACSLRDAERLLLLAASHYRRTLDLLVASASPWASVTAYYGSFHAARAILAMFGSAVFDWIVVDVRTSAPGNQELAVRRIGNNLGEEPSVFTGTHEQFWELFYNSVPPLVGFVDRSLAPILTPISGNPAWLTQTRNKLNYDSYSAIAAAADFQDLFAPPGFPASLPGELNTMYAVMEGLIVIAFSLAKQLSLNTDALLRLDPAGTLRVKTRSLVYTARSPSLVSRTKKRALTNLGA